MNASPAMQEKLVAAFGNRSTFDSFMRRAGSEAELARMRGAVGGSQTARRLQNAGFDPLEIGISAATGGSTGLFHAAIRAIQRNTTERMARETAREMGPMLMLQGAPNINELLSKWQQSTPLLSPTWTTQAPMAASRVPGLLGF